MPAVQAAWSSASASNLESEDHAANAAGGGLEETEMFFYYEEENPKTERIDHRKEITSIASQIVQNGNLSLRACQYAAEYGKEVTPVIALVEEK